MATGTFTLSIAPAVRRKQKHRKWALEKPIRSVELVYPPPPVWPAPGAVHYSKDGRPFHVGIEIDADCTDLFSLPPGRNWQLCVRSPDRTIHFWKCKLERWNQVPPAAGAVAWFVAVPLRPLPLGRRDYAAIGLIEDRDAH